MRAGDSDSAQFLFPLTFSRLRGDFSAICTASAAGGQSPTDGKSYDPFVEAILRECLTFQRSTCQRSTLENLKHFTSKWY